MRKSFLLASVVCFAAEKGSGSQSKRAGDTEHGENTGSTVDKKTGRSIPDFHDVEQEPTPGIRKAPAAETQGSDLVATSSARGNPRVEREFPGVSAPLPAGRRVGEEIEKHGIDDRDTIEDQPGDKEPETADERRELAVRREGERRRFRLGAGRLMRPSERKAVTKPTRVYVVARVYWGAKVGSERVWQPGEVIPNYVGVMSAGLMLEADWKRQQEAALRAEE